MLGRKPIEIVTLDTAIINLHTEMESVTADSPEYAKMVEQLAELHKIKASTKKSRSVSPDVLITVAANLAGILLVINHERVGVITSKAFGLIAKTKL